MPDIIQNVTDAMQSHLSFVQSQTAHREAAVYRMQYPDLDYASLIPVETSVNPWIKTVEYLSMDGVGKAEWISGNGKDMPTVGISMEKHEESVYTAGIGYSYGLEEVNQAAMLGISLGSEQATMANRAYREMTYNIAMSGDTAKGYTGLFNTASIPVLTLPADGTGSTTTWSTKTNDQVLRDLNLMITTVHATTNTIAMPNTLLMSPTRLQYLITTRLGDTETTLFDFFMKTNVYTAQTGQRLTVRGVRGMDTIGVGSTQRMLAYRRAPDVLKMHLPMPHRFMPVQIEGLQYTIPGIFRVGGVDVRLPKECLYADGF